jgi:hypothetical protein
VLEFLVAVLATWRIAVLFFYDPGPWDCFEKLRFKAGVYLEPKPFWGQQLACFYCVTLYAALVCSIVLWLYWYALVPFALSGAALLLSHGGRMIWREMNSE